MLKEYKALIITFIAWCIIGLVENWAIAKFVRFKYKPPIDIKQYSGQPIKEITILRPKEFDVSLITRLGSEVKETKEPNVLDKAALDLPQKTPEFDPTKFNIKMIIVSEAGNFAVVNDLVLKEGDVLEDFKIDKITGEGLQLSRGGEKVWIK